MKTEKSRKPNIHGWLGLFILVVAEILLFYRVEPVVSWFYSLAWWSYILIVDSLVYRLKGNSMIMNRGRRFLLLLPWSVTVWLIFEMFNLSLDNWGYVNLPSNVWLRWSGYAIAFATVLPGLFQTFELLDAFGLFKDRTVKPLSKAPTLDVPFVLIGVAMLVLSAVFPLYCFPLVWGGFIFLLEPFNRRGGGVSLVRQWEEGSLRTFWLLMGAGLVCGLLWEFWNMWSGSKWVYSVPFVGFLKVFEMPVLGFLGFPPFAVECYAMYGFAAMAMRVRSWERGAPAPEKPGRSLWIHALGYIIMAGFWVLAFSLMDLYTVVSFAS